MRVSNSRSRRHNSKSGVMGTHLHEVATPVAHSVCQHLPAAFHLRRSESSVYVLLFPGEPPPPPREMNSLR